MNPSRAFGLLGLLSLPAMPLLMGCDTAAFAANSTIQVVRRAAPAMPRFRDPELAEEAMPGTMGTLEGLMELQPNDLTLRYLLARSYMSYGFGFLEDHMERAEVEGAEEEQIDHWRRRASNAFLRGREISVGGLDLIHGEEGGIAGAKSRGLEAFTSHLARFNDRERDAPLLLVAAYNWARWIAVNRDDMNAVADLPFVMVVAERALALDETVLDYTPVALHAGLVGSPPVQLGGRPADAKVEFDRAIELTHRHNFMFLVTEAQICAVALQDRALFTSLLEEVIAGDLEVDVNLRLQNTLAQRRAARLLSQVDMLFAPEDEASAGASDDTSGGEAASAE